MSTSQIIKKKKGCLSVPRVIRVLHCSNAEYCKYWRIMPALHNWSILVSVSPAVLTANEEAVKLVSHFLVYYTFESKTLCIPDKIYILLRAEKSSGE